MESKYYPLGQLGCVSQHALRSSRAALALGCIHSPLRNHFYRHMQDEERLKYVGCERLAKVVSEVSKLFYFFSRL